MRTPEPEPIPLSRGHDVFGKVARPDGDGPGARVQDLALFDGAPTPTRAAAKASRRRRRGDGPSLPLLVAGAVAAGIGLAVGLTSGIDRARPDELTLTMPDLPAAPSTPPIPSTPSTPPTRSTPESVETPETLDASSPDAESTGPGPSRTRSAPSATVPVTPTAAGTESPVARPPVPVRTSASPVAPPPEPSHTGSARPSGRPDPEVLRVGSSGPEVEDLQWRLQRLHLYLGSADGTFSSFVAVALSRFQEARDIPEERGAYGPLTRAALRAETGRGGRGGGSGEDGDEGRDEWGGWDG
ncbi:peptidoglycan-binding protein [Streptomyces sp. NPDC085460]|uniref:peptidoglycan-binding domain-containing protein n=1 Tax=Streptomyces sp. NPDC085460 TaxID=3365723 RepID=UPI0037D957BF